MPPGISRRPSGLVRAFESFGSDPIDLEDFFLRKYHGLNDHVRLPFLADDLIIIISSINLAIIILARVMSEEQMELPINKDANSDGNKDRKEKLDIKEDPLQSLGLHLAASQGKSDKINEIVQGIPADKRLFLINVHNIHGFTPLQSAVFNDQPDAVETLLHHGADPHRPVARQQWTFALNMAAVHAGTKVIRMLLNAGADPFLLDWSGMSPMQVAELSGKKSVVQLLRSTMEAQMDMPCKQLPELLSSLPRVPIEDRCRVRRVLVEEEQQLAVEDFYSYDVSPLVDELSDYEIAVLKRPPSQPITSKELSDYNVLSPLS